MLIKSHFPIAVIIVFFSVVLLFPGCKKKDETKETETFAPTVNTGSATMVGQNWATLRGNVLSNGLSTTVTIEYDTTTSFENSINATPNTIDESNFVSVYAALTGLETAKQYYFRVKAENSKGTVYGSDTLFSTLNISDSLLAFNPQLSYGTVSDIDANMYKTIQIGTQTWMAENLRTLRLNDGTELPYVVNSEDWGDLETPAYCWFTFDSAYYGALYNWYTIDTDILCPEGWSIPSDDDWATLIDYLGGEVEAGNALKETGSRHWLYTSGEVTNESGFTALPGGYRNLHGTFGNIKNSGYIWSSTESASTTAFYRGMYYGYSNVDRGNSSKKSGFSVRCIKDPVIK